jgi:hypothetical protein
MKDNGGRGSSRVPSAPTQVRIGSERGGAIVNRPSDAQGVSLGPSHLFAGVRTRHAESVRHIAPLGLERHLLPEPYIVVEIVLPERSSFASVQLRPIY